MARNCALFLNLPENFDPATLDAALESVPLKPLGGLEMATSGFGSPYAPEGTALTQRVGHHIGGILLSESRVLPAAAVRSAADKVAEEEAQRTGEPVGRKRKKQIKEEVELQMIPKAFIVAGGLMLTINTRDGWITANSAGEKAAQSLIERLREGLGSFAVTPAFSGDLRSVMTKWMRGEAVPDGVQIGDSADLEDSGGAKIKVSGLELSDPSILEHLDNGFQCTRIDLAIDGKVTLSLSDDFSVKKIKPTDSYGNESAGEMEEQQAYLDSEFLYESGMLDIVHGFLKGIKTGD